MNIIEIRGLKKDYPLGTTIVPALRGVDLEVAEGELMSIIGPSGSGKTTLLNIIGCIDPATAGSVRVGGREVTSLTDAQITDIRLNKIGFIFQTFNLIPVLEKPAAEARARAEKLVEEVGLKEYAAHRPAELSGGQRQRVAIARALVTNPDIVLADEPTANLDSVTGASILELMRKMNEVEKTTFIFSTHDANVLKYAKRIVKIKDGLIEKEGVPA
jgi:putative ABC transport system ATP-binding protein